MKLSSSAKDSAGADRMDDKVVRSRFESFTLKATFGCPDSELRNAEITRATEVLS